MVATIMKLTMTALLLPVRVLNRPLVFHYLLQVWSYCALVFRQVLLTSLSK